MFQKSRFTWKDTVHYAGRALLFSSACGIWPLITLDSANQTSLRFTFWEYLVTAVWTNGHFVWRQLILSSVLPAFNFLFTEPRFTFQANDPSYPVTFLIMLFIQRDCKLIWPAA